MNEKRQAQWNLSREICIPWWALGLFVFLLFSILGCGAESAREAPEVVDSIAEVGEGKELGEGVVHVRELDLAKGTFVRWTVQQLGVDVTLRLEGPGLEKPLEAD